MLGVRRMITTKEDEMLTDDDIKDYASGKAHVPQDDAAALALMAGVRGQVIAILEAELAEAVAALRKLCSATGEEGMDAGDEMWMEADRIVALHDEDTDDE